MDGEGQSNPGERRHPVDVPVSRSDSPQHKRCSMHHSNIPADGRHQRGDSLRRPHSLGIRLHRGLRGEDAREATTTPALEVQSRTPLSF